MVDEFGSARTSIRYFYLMLTMAELSGFVSVVLIGILFGSKKLEGPYDWSKSPFNFHPFMLTLGMLFCYGNAILSYRTFRNIRKLPVKIMHAALLALSLIFTLVGFTAAVRDKNESKPPNPHFMSLHSWLGILTISLFILQWICGFISFLFPKLSLRVRLAYMPSHKFWGKAIFLCALATVLMGISEYGLTSFFAENDKKRPQRLIMIFFGLFATLFTLVVLYLVSNPGYQRSVDDDEDEMSRATANVHQ